MPQNIDVNLAVVLWKLKNDLSYARTLRWPDLETIDRSPRQLLASLETAARKLVKSGFPRFFSPIRSIDPYQLALRQIPTGVRHLRLNVNLAPPDRDACWKTPVDVTFDIVIWPVQNFRIAAVPVLGIEMRLTDQEGDEPRIEARIRQVLAIRYEKDFGLRQILRYRELRESSLHCLRVPVELPTLPENVRLEHGRSLKTEDRHRWEKLGVRFFDSRNKPAPGYGFGPAPNRLGEELSGDPPRPVLLVGPGGAGKTALWQEFVRNALDDETFHGVRFGETDATLLVSTDDDWQARCDLLVKLAAEERAVLHLGNLWELTQVGMGEGQNRSLGAYLVPAAADRFAYVCECTAQQLAVLEQEQPGVLFPLVKIEVDEPDESRSATLYRTVAETSYPGLFDEAAIEKIDALHRRYATYSAAPGRPLRFLHNIAAQRLALQSTAPEPVTVDDVVSAFSLETGLPMILLDDSTPMDVKGTTDWFRRRIIGQDGAVSDGAGETETGAVSIIVDMLLTYKARLTRPDRPIASLLFVGPTGVGKTETAKALAEFLYGDPKRLIRIDMSEFAEYGAAERLIRGNRHGEGLLTSKIRQQPFSVLLLDEFEKGHEEVFDLLLQVLGEGRLTDAGGRVADFRNCVILMTSNLGVERFGRSKAGFEPTEDDAYNTVSKTAGSHFATEAARLLRPEMLNRIDRIVDRGYEPQFGARPLRRILEREFLLPMAEALRRFPGRTPLDVRVFLDGEKISVTAVAVPGLMQAEARHQAELARLARLTEFRRKVRKLKEHSVVEEMKGRIKRAETIRIRLEKRRKGPNPKPGPDEWLRFLDRVDRVDLPMLDRVIRLDESAVRAEEQSLLDYYRENPAADPGAQGIDALATEYDSLVFSFFNGENESPDRLLLITYGKTPETTEALLRLYEDCAALLGLRTERYALEVCSTPEQAGEISAEDVLLSKSDGKVQTVHARRLNPGQPKTIPGRSQPAQLLEIRGPRAGHLFGGEFGKHRLVNVGPRNHSFECSVEISYNSIEEFFPRIDSRGAVQISDSVLRRTVDFAALENNKVRPETVYDAASLRTTLLNRLEKQIDEWLDE